MNRVQGKVALVTGAAKGIGASTATLLAAEGARVVLTDLDEVQGLRVAAQIVERGGEAIFLRQDVRMSRTSRTGRVSCKHASPVTAP